MSSDVDIANLALAHLGEDANIAALDPPEGYPHAERCARFYTIARNTLLEMHPWSFATKRVDSPAQRETETTTWQYAYVMPSDCLKPFAVLPYEATDDYSTSLLPPSSPYTNPYALQFTYFPSYQTKPFEYETLLDGTVVVYTNEPSASIRYIASITDAAKYTPGFVVALSRFLASFLAGPVIKGDVGRAEAKGQYQIFLVEFGRAAASDANTQTQKVKQVVPWIAGRR